MEEGEADMKKILLIALFMIISAMLFAGPFGMEYGWSLNELEASGAEVMVFNGDSRITACFISPTKPHPDLDSYAAYIDSEYGIYMIRAISETLDNEYDLRELYERLKEQLSSVYGEPFETDEIYPGNLWKYSWDFIRSIYYGERILASTWYPEMAEGAARDISLYINAYDEYSASITLEYTSQDYQAVWDAYNASATSVL